MLLQTPIVWHLDFTQPDSMSSVRKENVPWAAGTITPATGFPGEP